MNLNRPPSTKKGSVMPHPSCPLASAEPKGRLASQDRTMNWGKKRTELKELKELKELRERRKRRKKGLTYNSGDSLVVTHRTTSPPVQCLISAEQTGRDISIGLWSYVTELRGLMIYI